jgi:hypothetical protein
MNSKTGKEARYNGTYLQSQHSGDTGRRILSSKPVLATLQDPVKKERKGLTE